MDQVGFYDFKVFDAFAEAGSHGGAIGELV